MAMSDAAKRKEPEPSSVETAEAAAASDVQTASAEGAAPSASAPASQDSASQPAAVRTKPEATGEPEQKRLKPTPPDLAAVRKQVEYYLSDENLRYDKFFSEKIASDPEGWLDMNMVLSCNKMKLMRASKEDVIASLKDSKIEVRSDSAAVRRPGNTPLPKLEAKPQHQKKSSIHAHDGGIVAIVRRIPEEQGWSQVKAKLQEKLPKKVAIWHASEVDDTNSCTVCVAPFEGDIQFFEDLELDIGGAKVKAEVCHGDELQKALRLVPKHVRDRRERESKKRQKERSRPIIIGNQRFLNVAALRGRVKEILNSRSDGEQLKTDGSDFKLIKALLEFHPKGAEKSVGLIGLKVGKSEHGDNRCFFMMKEGGPEEDFSAKKCLDNVELNPPYVKGDAKASAEKGATKETEGEAPAGTPAATPAAEKAQTEDKPEAEGTKEAAEEVAKEASQEAAAA